MIRILFVLFLLNIGFLNAQSTEIINLDTFFNGHAGTIVIYDISNNKLIKHTPERAAQRFLPASTFKIPNSLFGLESGVIEDENFVIKWDGIERDFKEWNRDHSLSSALKVSNVPYYQELARRVGKEKLQQYLDTINYGNKTIGNTVDRFWLDNSLKISADEQIDFLKKFYNYELPFSKRNIDIVKSIMSEEKYSGSTLKFKTGTGNKQDGTFIGWLVGYVEKGTNVYFFAFNVEADTFQEVSGLRNSASRDILKELKILE